MVLKSIEFYNQYAKDFTLKTWGKELNIPIVFNKARRTFGEFHGVRDRGTNVRKPVRINLSIVSLESHEKAIDTLKHELCHWQAYTENEDFSDGQDYFENLLKSVGASSTMTCGNLELSAIIQGSSESGRRKGTDNMKVVEVQDTAFMDTYKSVFYKASKVFEAYEGEVYLGKILKVEDSSRVRWVTIELIGTGTSYNTRKSAFLSLLRKKMTEMEEFAEAHAPK